MTKWILAAFLAALIFPATGTAQTTIIEPSGSHFPYQRWIDESKVPTPDVTIEVIEEEPGDGCPADHGPFGYMACTSPSEHKIWIAASQLIGYDPRETFLHEIGHNFDAYVMPEWARGRFDTIYGLGGPWFANPGEMTAGEWFAEAYAECAVKPYVNLAEWNSLGLGPVYGGRTIFEMRVAHNRACRLIQGL